MHVLIVDDELLARNRLRVLLNDCCDAAAPFTVSEASSTAAALELLESQAGRPVDLILLDIQMPGPNGLGLAQLLHQRPSAPPVVFVTAHSMYAPSAFEVEAVDYLTKPVRLDRLQQALAKVRRLRGLVPAAVPDSVASPAQQVCLLIRDRGRTERVPLSQVIYLKAEQKYVTVRTAARSYILDSSLNELDQRYPQLFVRIHRNALVARAHMHCLEKHYTDEDGEGWAMRLHGVQELLMVSRRQLAAVRAEMNAPPRSAETA